jgi:hypothetical protein
MTPITNSLRPRRDGRTSEVCPQHASGPHWIAPGAILCSEGQAISNPDAPSLHRRATLTW